MSSAYIPLGGVEISHKLDLFRFTLTHLLRQNGGGTGERAAVANSWIFWNRTLEKMIPKEKPDDS